MNIEQAYERVNAATPDISVSTLTLPEAQQAVRKMYRHLTGQKFPYRIEETSGNRYTWLRGMAFKVNVGKGWDDLIHLFSHWYHRTRFTDRPHSKSHARVELKLRKWAIARGWLAGALKPDVKPTVLKTPDDARAKLIERRQAQVARLERKIKALTTRLKRAKRSLAGLERAAQKS